MYQPFIDTKAKNWEDIENLWTYNLYDILKVCLEKCYSAIIESTLNQKKYRE